MKLRVSGMPASDGARYVRLIPMPSGQYRIAGSLRHKSRAGRRGEDRALSGLALLDQEAFLGQLGALHLFAHPARHEASAGPLQALVFPRLVLRLGLRTRTATTIGLWYAHDAADDAGGFP